MVEADQNKSADTSASFAPDKVANEDRILRRGDLARIIGSKGKLNDHHKGALARIVKSNPIKDEETELKQNGHDFTYDIELILGGKLNGVRRFELQYTTAFEEGMTGDSRRQRKRKPSQLVSENSNCAEIDSSTARKKEKKTSVNGKANAKTTTKNANSKKRGSKTVNNANGKKKSKNSKSTTATSEVTKVIMTNSNNPNSGLGMFERHRREFERCLLRLQKIDVYNFFSDDDVPPEYDECYELDSNSTVDQTDSAPLENGALEPSGALHTSATSSSSDMPLSISRENVNEKESKSITFPNHPPYNFVVLRKRLERGRYLLDRLQRVANEENFDCDGTKITVADGRRLRSPSFSLQHPTGIDWELFRDDIIGMCSTAVRRNSDNFDDGSPGTLSNTAEKITTAMEQIYEKTGRRQSKEMNLSNDAHRFTKAIEDAENKEAALQGKTWRRKAFPERQYERLRTDAVCAGLSELDERIASYELRTSLKDSFLGLSYTYNDTGQSEGWMKSMLSEGEEKNKQEKAAMALSSDDGVIKAQVTASMQSLLIAVQDRVMTENGVLEQKELRSANWECGMEKVGEQVVSTNHLSSNAPKPEIVEQPVWGIDCYTRKNISICLETKFNSDTVLIFIEKWLLPAINACPVDLAYNLSNAARILEGLPFDVESSLNQRKGTTTEQWSTTLLGRALLNKIKETAPPWLNCAARILRKAIDAMGYDFFRVHPKGHGSIVLSPKIEPNRLVTFYRGEVYPSWRWGEKMDAISLIQQRNNLKPRLPDFYNMALERPQMDPRGYGLLFVDASRKSGYGSMLSHSCNPSCEVRVAAVNGKLTLAMTTLRELTIGDEVTFDYNAVTESLHEYQAAVCLCGQGQCRGSFLHFATADCYQQVLNRNSPIAVRLSDLIRGCAKKVMADDDVAILKRHGFQTAAFGAVSVNRRNASTSEFADASLDSMDFVPIWLKTHVADILRYIEYERRALPIALISNDITRSQDESGGAVEKKKETNASGKKDPGQPNSSIKSIDEKPVKGCKPEPTFFYFLRRKRESMLSSLNSTGAMSGGEIEREIKKEASMEWKTFNDKTKQYWKEQAIADWEENGGKKKANLEQQRLKRLARLKNSKQSKASSKVKKETNPTPAESSADVIESERNTISLQAADAEGITAMEQRIQQLTQALSRVGRVLDRHREELLRKQQIENQTNRVICLAELRELAHSPLAIMPNEEVVAWMWSHENGIVRTLLRMADNEVCVSPDIRLALKEIESKYSCLSGFGTPWNKDSSADSSVSPSKGRQLLDEALMEFRSALVDGIRGMATEIKNLRASARGIAKKRKEKIDIRKEQAEHFSKISTSSSASEIRCAIEFVLDDMIDAIEKRDSNIGADGMEITEPWLNNYNKRFKLEKAADLLLMYRRTSTFFKLMPYESLQSTPIEVYAREVGNSVPRSVIENKENHKPFPEHQVRSCEDVDMGDENGKVKPSKESKKGGMCEPEDIISEVVVDYQGDYVLSQLLQWYNAGIDQKPGLPDLLGCALLPSMEGCFTIDPTKGSNSSTGTRTKYQTNIRPKLVEWFQDPFKRGNPWTDELRRCFVNKDDKVIENESKLWVPIGSPVLDFLVTGDDHNLVDVLSQLGIDSTTTETNVSDGLLSSVDHGRPAQAVSNWVQCENPECQKWRKIPWHVDIDMLSKKFVCSDHIWGLDPPSCEAPEEDWDETTDACVEADGSVKPNDKTNMLSIKNRERNAGSGSRIPSKDLKIGCRFDVLRPGKEKWSVANIVDTSSKRIKFHFVKTQAKNDVWLEKNSDRIAPLHSHTTKPKPKPKTQLSSTMNSKCSKAKFDLSSKLNKLKTKKVKSNPESSKPNNESITTITTKSKKSSVELRIEDDKESDSDGLSFCDIDDEESDDESSIHDDIKHKDTSGYGKHKEEVEESPTVTDHSSSDGSLKKDCESTPAEHSDIENEYSKPTSQSNSKFTIPKKNESTKKSSSNVIPKKVLPKKNQSLSSGTSLISEAARQAMLEKNKEKQGSKFTKKTLSLNRSPAKDFNPTQRNRKKPVDHDSPISNRQAYSDSYSPRSHDTRSPASNTPQTSESPTKDGNYRRSMLSPKRSLNDRCYPQQNDKQLYRDSKEYSVRGESSTYQDSSDNRDYSTRSPKRLLNDRYSVEQNREREQYYDLKECTNHRENSRYGDSSDSRDHSYRSYSEQNDMLQRSPSSDYRRRVDRSVDRNYEPYSQQDQYESDRYRSRQYDRSRDHEDYSPRRERSRDYYSRNVGNEENDRRNHEYQTERRLATEDKNHNDYRRVDDYKRREEVEPSVYASRRNEYDRESSLYASTSREYDYARRGREYDERDIERDNYRHGIDYEQKYSARSDDRDYYRDDDRYNSRRHQESESRHESRRKRKFDDSDEYSRRLDTYQTPQGRNYSNEDRRDRYNHSR